MNTRPDWNAGTREARRIVAESTVVVQPDRATVNMALCLLSVSAEEREQHGWEREWGPDGEPIVTPAAPEGARTEPAGEAGRTITYGDGSTWPWWVHVEPVHDTHRTPEADQRYMLTLSDDAMDAAHGEGWEGQAGDTDGFTHVVCHTAAWRLNAAIVGGPAGDERDRCPKCGNSTSPEAGATWKRGDGTCYNCEPAIEWVDGRCEVGGVVLVHGRMTHSHTVASLDAEGCGFVIRYPDEATAKRLALAVARALAGPA
jgi:hypothetical protein